MGQRQELMALRGRVEEWRRGGGGRGSRIPEELWSEAVAVAGTTGLHATARALGFNYENLKKRAMWARKGVQPSKPAMKFVALPMPAFSNGLKVVIDLVASGGERMRVEVSGSGAEVGTLVHALWRGRA